MNPTLVQAIRVRCAECHRILATLPAFDCETGPCPYCNGSWLLLEPRRPIGPRSRLWPEMLAAVRLAVEVAWPTDGVRWAA